MISTILFTKIAFAQYDCRAIHDEHTCLNDPYESCAWFGQCATTVQSQCYSHTNSWDCGFSYGCSWDVTQNKCTQDGCGYHSCRSDCNGISGCGWEEYCDYNDYGATKHKANDPCYRRLDEETGEELEAPTEELEAPSFGDWLSSLLGMDTYTHRRTEYSAEDEKAAFIPDGRVQSDDAETEDTEDNESEDTEETETDDRRRHSVPNYDQYCSKYYYQGQCDVDSVCSWHTLYGHWNNGLCKGKHVTGCVAYDYSDCAYHVGNTGQPCQWVGPLHGPGSCVEKAAPAPSPTPSNTCGMWFSESSCPSNCHWNARQNRCEAGAAPIPPPNSCGMWFSESSCPSINCHWNARQNRCERGAAPSPTPSPNTCGMWQSQSACPSNCEWHYWEQKCVAKPQADCSSYSDWSHCAFAEGCKWNIIQDICSPKGTRDIFCDTLMSYSWCNKFQSSGCYWSAHHNQCLAH